MAQCSFYFNACIFRFCIRLRRLKLTPQPLSLRTAHIDPYRLRVLRKLIDGAAFRVYGHWVKRNDGQNRAAMFEHQPKVIEINAIVLY